MNFFKKLNNYSVNVIVEGKESGVQFDRPNETFSYKNVSKLETDDANSFQEIDLGNKVIATESNDQEGCDFEAAIEATSFGKYNWFLMFVSFWGSLAGMFNTATMSLILPSIDCDLNLSSVDKGILNSITYFGAVSSAFFWGHLSDSMGRRKVVLRELALDVFLSVLVGLAQNYTLLVIGKFFSGFVNSSMVVILASLVAECHAKKYRSSITVGVLGVFFSCAIVILPLLAWAIIPNPINLTIFDGYLYLPSWRIFLIVCSLPSAITFLGLLFCVESPKFLMSQKRNEEAMRAFKKIYSVNTGNSPDEYPVKFLQNSAADSDESTEKNLSFKENLCAGLKQMASLFEKPYLWLTLLPCTMQFFTLLCTNSVRLWSPQIFDAAIENENAAVNSSFLSNACDLLISNSDEKMSEEMENCQEHTVDYRVYFNLVIAGVVAGVISSAASYGVKYLDKKWLLMVAYPMSTGCLLAFYWSTTSTYMVVLISLLVGITSTTATVVSSIVIDIFPTFLRTTAMSLCLTFGRLGSLLGSMVFPILFDWNCASPFFFLVIILIVTAILSSMLPKTKGKNLE